VLFCGSLPALTALRNGSQECRIFEIGGRFPVLPVNRNSENPNLPESFWIGPIEHDDVTLSLRPSDVAFVSAASRNGPIAYIETEYFGGEGRQSAALWRDGALVMDLVTESSEQTGDLAEAPINRALRQLGVVVGDHFDEFSAQGLDRYRFNSDIFQKGTECALVG
jgi:hypothetical protein